MRAVKKIRTAIRIVPFMLINHVIARLTKIQRRRVLFVSDVREELGGNLKAVYDYLPDNFEKQVDLKADRRCRRTLAAYIRLAYHMAVCEYILLEDFLDYTAFIKMRPGQQICQLWHGAGAYKKFGFSRQANPGEKIKIHQGYKRYAKAVVSAEAIRPCYAEAFSIPLERVKATGIPRTDIFFDRQYIAQKKEALLQEYAQLRGKKIILFAPTYRGTLVNDAGYDFQQLDLEYLYQQLHGEYMFIFKWHPAAYNNLVRGEIKGYSIAQYPDFYLDLSSFRDINDLLLITDILVTDYSSVIFDYFLVHRPIVYYVPDLQEYEGGRGLYYPFQEYVYGDTAADLPALVNAIRQGDMHEEERASFGEKFMEACDGHAVKKTCEWIFNQG